MITFFCAICTIFTVQFQTVAQDSLNTDFIVSGQEATSLSQNIIWLRCSVGQRWVLDGGCAGQPLLVTHDEAVLASQMASEQLNGMWRLPTRVELESLVCMKCDAPKLNADIFPATPSGSVWTSTPSRKNFFWIVNFLNGVSYGVGYKNQRRYVRLVQDVL